MLPTRWLQPGRRLLVMFLSITLVLVMALAWMSWQWIGQDRALAAQRMQERRESTADLAVAALQRQLSQTEEQLTALSAGGRADLRASGPPADTALLVFRSGELQVFTQHPLLYYPERAPADDAPAGLFATADRLEFRDNDYARACEALRSLVRHPDPGIKAEALMRLGRNFAKSGSSAQALDAYAELARLGPVSVAGLPAALVAHEARLLLLEKQGAAAARQEAGVLCGALHAGTWKINRTTYEFYTRESCGKTGTEADGAALALAAAVESMADEWTEIGNGSATLQGRRAAWIHGRPVLALWRSSGQGVAALVCGAEGMRSLWGSRPDRVTLTDSEGRTVFGSPPAPGAQQSLRLAAATQLPWTVHVVSGAQDITSADRTRERLILTGMLTLLLLVLAGSYFIARAAGREMAVTRLQSDFVASVSHEFRTPITALRQLSELLASGRVASEEDRGEYYRALSRESERMHRLVEGLLNFGRLESGAMQYRFEPLDPVELVQAVVAEFRRDVEPRGYRVEFETNGARPQVRADRDALGCVISNLLDNAMKYSADCATVWVEVGRDVEDCVAIRVRDRGIGIPQHEQGQIFQKFVRGAAAKDGSIRGAGVGLAMVRQIVTAHNGDIRLESRTGEGSTFTVLLPEVS